MFVKGRSLLISVLTFNALKSLNMDWIRRTYTFSMKGFIIASGQNSGKNYQCLCYHPIFFLMAHLPSATDLKNMTGWV